MKIFGLVIIKSSTRKKLINDNFEKGQLFQRELNKDLVKKLILKQDTLIIEAMQAQYNKLLAGYKQDKVITQALQQRYDKLFADYTHDCEEFNKQVRDWKDSFEALKEQHEEVLGKYEVLLEKDKQDA